MKVSKERAGVAFNCQEATIIEWRINNGNKRT